MTAVTPLMRYPVATEGGVTGGVIIDRRSARLEPAQTFVSWRQGGARAPAGGCLGPLALTQRAP